MKRSLPQVLSERGSVAAGRFDFDLHIPVSLPEFEGHFPGMPILSGVAQVDWAIRFGIERNLLQGKINAVENLRFVSPIHPEMALALTLEILAARNRVAFSYTSSSKPLSSGVISLEPANAG